MNDDRASGLAPQLQQGTSQGRWQGMYLINQGAKNAPALAACPATNACPRNSCCDDRLRPRLRVFLLTGNPARSSPHTPPRPTCVYAATCRYVSPANRPAHLGGGGGGGVVRSGGCETTAGGTLGGTVLDDSFEHEVTHNYGALPYDR